MSKDKNKLGWETKYRRSKKWLIGLTTFLTASTGVTTGLAIYYATRPNVATVEVNFHVDDDGILTGGKTQKVIKGSKIGQLPVPVKEASKNQIFSHWVDFDGKQYKTSDEITTNIDVYAVYKEAGKLASTVTMELNGGVIEGLSTINQVLVIRGSVIASLPSPVIDGGIFSHWKTKEGTKISPAETIDGDRTVYAEYKDVSSSTYLVDGQTLVQVKPGKEGQISRPWKLMHGKTEVTGATWTVSLPSELPENCISVDSNGLVTWNGNVPAGEYEIGISAEKGDIIGTTNFAVVCREDTYTIDTEFLYKEVHPDETVVFDTSADQFVLLDEESAPVVQNLEWKIEDDEATEAGISIATDGEGIGTITCTNVKAGRYETEVHAYIKDELVAYRQIVINSTARNYTLGAGVSKIEVDDNRSTTATAFTILKDGSTYTPTETVTWTVKPDTEPAEGTITISNGAITVDSVTAGNYTLTVKASWTDAAGLHEPTATVTLVSKSTKAQGITIEGDEYVTSTLSSQYNANVYPSGAAASIKWTIEDGNWYYGNAPTINETTGALSTDKDTYGYGYITATDTVTGLSAQKWIEVDQPFVYSNLVWIYDINLDGYFNLNMDDLCNPNSTTIRAYKVNNYYRYEEDVIYRRAIFGQNDGPISNIYIGGYITSIPDNFCANMPEFNAKINFSYPDLGYQKSSVSSIGKNFLMGCTKWNNSYYGLLGVDYPFELPDSLKTIDDGFLDGCNAFNNGTVASKPFNLPADVTTIGTDFMNECKAFNQDITIPSSVTHVGDNFMVDCNNMTSTLTVNCDTLAFDIPSTESYNLSVSSTAEPAYTNHVKIAGAYRDEFIAAFPNREPGATVTSAYRKLDEYHSNFETCTWDTIGACAKKYLEVDTPYDLKFFNLIYVNGSEPLTFDPYEGAERELVINNATHKTKVIGINHDTLTSDTSKTAAFTFELSDVLTVKTTEHIGFRSFRWADEEYGRMTNHDYSKTLLRYNIDNYYTNATITLDLARSIVPVQKQVYATDSKWTTGSLKTYTATLFAFTATELGLHGSQIEGSKYTNPTVRKGIAEEGYAVRYWLASADTTSDDYVYFVDDAGKINRGHVAKTENPIAASFGFCI